MTTTLIIPAPGVPHPGTCANDDADVPHAPLTVTSAMDRTRGTGVPLELCRACLIDYAQLAEQSLAELTPTAYEGTAGDDPHFHPELTTYLREVAWYTQTLAAWPVTP
jgi:hypothetical protein